ncbi:MAG: polysaccharide deacetylase family protein [Candidatus Omnitrophica bacterium]|nr:polysaccharide deacetylase family protein [Candidatus Omnitrophota bacterium]
MARILMYHGIVDAAKSAVIDREKGAELYDVKLEEFRKQLAWLKEQKYVLTMDISGREQEAVFTFDDGEKNNFNVVAPILQDLKAFGYFFVIADRIGRDGYLSWEDLARMKMAGMVIGSHGLTHGILTSLSEDGIREELTKSKFILESNLRCHIDCLSIPRGFYDERVVKIAKEAGYQKIFVSDKRPGFSDGCYERIAVKNDWTIKEFAAAVSGKMGFKMRLFTILKLLVRRILGDKLYDLIRSVLLRK